MDSFSIEAGVKTERLNPKKILPFEEYAQDSQGRRVVKKLVGYNRGEAQHFVAIKNEKGKWIADMDKMVSSEGIDKVICDIRTGKVVKKDTEKGLWFIKTAPAEIINDWLVEDVYNFWTEEHADNMLKVYEYLKENNLVGVYKFNPYGTAYNGFLIPQAVNGAHFRLLLKVARVKTNKPEVSPTMTITGAREREREKQRIERVGIGVALDEV